MLLRTRSASKQLQPRTRPWTKTPTSPRELVLKGHSGFRCTTTQRWTLQRRLQVNFIETNSFHNRRLSKEPGELIQN